MNLDKLFNNSSKADEYPGCKGCSNLDRNLPVHCYKPPFIKEVDIVFLMDSYHWSGSTIEDMSPLEQVVFNNYVDRLCKDFTYIYLPAVSCPGVREVDMSASDMKICRKYMEEYIFKAKPKLIFCLGNLSMKMLLGKSGITNKRGTTYYYNQIPVIPLLHPMSVALEPKNTSIFQQDIKNGVNKYLRGITTDPGLKTTIVMSLDELQIECQKISSSTGDIAVDIETTGLDFKKDKITTVGISYNTDEGLKQVIIPYKHFESPFSEGDLKVIRATIGPLFMDPNRRKILQNAHFDLKFLLEEGIEFTRVWDTKLMSHSVNENMPKSLKDLVKQFFPEFLETL